MTKDKTYTRSVTGKIARVIKIPQVTTKEWSSRLNPQPSNSTPLMTICHRDSRDS
ncbi:MAG TPA: hypothetical protein VIQ81_09315 [Gammaproteobacteria bacterium]